jgi:hypothetical protein
MIEREPNSPIVNETLPLVGPLQVQLWDTNYDADNSGRAGIWLVANTAPRELDNKIRDAKTYVDQALKAVSASLAAGVGLGFLAAWAIGRSQFKHMAQRRAQRIVQLDSTHE